jgi:hypothetical protein
MSGSAPLARSLLSPFFSFRTSTLSTSTAGEVALARRAPRLMGMRTRASGVSAPSLRSGLVSRTAGRLSRYQTPTSIRRSAHRSAATIFRSMGARSSLTYHQIRLKDSCLYSPMMRR